MVLLNRTTSTASITARWSDLGISGAATVRNPWTAIDLGSYTGNYTASVPAREAVLLVISTSGGQSPSVTPTTPGQSPTVTPTTSPPSSGGGCRVRFAVNQCNVGFTADVTITNAGATAINGWTLRWTWLGNQQVTSAWNATVTQQGTQVTATNVSWNAGIAAGASTSFGFQATYSGSNPAPTQFTLNGVACTTG